MKNDALLNLILHSMPNDETIEALKKKIPKNGFIPAKDVSFSQKEFNEIKDTFVEETERGLTYIARILENLGRSYKDIFPLQIDEEVRERGGGLGYSIELSYRGKSELKMSYGQPSVAVTCIHEFGHGIDHCLDRVNDRVIDLFKKHSIKNNGEYLREETYKGSGEWIRELDFETPSEYTRKEYLDKRGRVYSTELTSSFFEYIINRPESFFTPKYRTYFTEMIRIWKKIK